MDMETRKSNWSLRVHAIVQDKLSPGKIRAIVSICQDAFNEGHRAGYAEAKGLWSKLPMED